MNAEDHLTDPAAAARSPAAALQDRPARSPHRDTLVAAVSEIATVLRAGADASEDRRSLVPASLHALRSSGLLAALAPEEVGGYQVDPITELELIEAVSAIDGSAGWLYWALAGSTARAASMLPQLAAAEIFVKDAPFPLFAFQEHPFGNVVYPSPAGLRVSGRWPFGTGVADADWVIAVGTVDPAARRGAWPDSAELAAAVPVSEVTVVDTWDAAGLAGTGTFDYEIDDLLVPWRRVWAYPQIQPVRGGIHFCFRRAPIKHIGFALGVARHSLIKLAQHIRARAGANRTTEGAVKTQVARSALALDAARALGLETVANVWQEARHTGTVAPESRIRLRATARYVTDVAVDVCSLAIHHGDASIVARQHPLQRNLRDIAVGSSHSEVSEAALEEFGVNFIADRWPPLERFSDDVHRADTSL